MYLDEELQEYFNKMSKKGWRLDFIGYYYRFSHDEHVYKYQIDYTPISSEYQDILKEMGYHEVRNSFDDFRVLENEKVIQCVYFVIHCISVCYDDAFFLYEKRGDHRRETGRSP